MAQWLSHVFHFATSVAPGFAALPWHLAQGAGIKAAQGVKDGELLLAPVWHPELLMPVVLLVPLLLPLVPLVPLVPLLWVKSLDVGLGGL